MQTQQLEASRTPARVAWSVNSVADLCEISTKTVRREISAGRLKAFKVGTAVRITDESLRDWLSRLSQRAAA